MTREESLFYIAYAIIKVFKGIIEKSRFRLVTYKKDDDFIINEIIKKAEEKFNDVVESKHKDKPKRKWLHFPWKGGDRNIKIKIFLEVAIDSMISSFENRDKRKLSEVECNKLMDDILKSSWSAFILNIEANNEDKSKINVLLREAIRTGETIEKVNQVKF